MGLGTVGSHAILRGYFAHGWGSASSWCRARYHLLVTDAKATTFSMAYEANIHVLRDCPIVINWDVAEAVDILSGVASAKGVLCDWANCWLMRLGRGWHLAEIGWIPPVLVCIKVNCDRAVDILSGVASAKGVLNDWANCWLMRYTRFIGVSIELQVEL
ncbi:hypothetical protein GOBAR_DD04639 [Gossypium barbadense]|nr:hypothetical protein GOBAR_DD04639 [Gossypium barbadense]